MKVLVHTQAQAHSAFLLMLLCLLGFLQKHCFFIVFCVNHNPNPCIMWRSCENPRKHTSIHFCDVAKKASSEHKTICNTYTSVSEKPCKKVVTFWNRVPVREGGRVRLRRPWRSRGRELSTFIVTSWAVMDLASRN